MESIEATNIDQTPDLNTPDSSNPVNLKNDTDSSCTPGPFANSSNTVVPNNVKGTTSSNIIQHDMSHTSYRAGNFC